ncbi:MAG TPA: signal peptidase I [Steroidobacteraceae bacterium]|nr:signal peptidase I [Steroidobacteraceae bacterium]
MRHLLTLLVVALLFGLEFTLWLTNPMHIPTAFLPARAFGLQLFREPGPAMEPTLPADQHVLMSSWAYWREPPRVGDVVAFAYPADPSVADVKRIVATAGSTVEIRNGALLVDGKQRQEPYLKASDGRIHRDMHSISVPPDSYFVMGDNRDLSEDSRNYGVIARDRIIGKQLF